MKKYGMYDKPTDMYKVKGSMNDMMQASKPKKCDAIAAQRYDMSRVRNIPFNQQGYPSQAFDYKY